MPKFNKKNTFQFKKKNTELKKSKKKFIVYLKFKKCMRMRCMSIMCYGSFNMSEGTQ